MTNKIDRWLDRDIHDLNYQLLRLLRTSIRDDVIEASRCFGLSRAMAQRVGRLTREQVDQVSQHAELLFAVPGIKELEGLLRVIEAEPIEASGADRGPEDWARRERRELSLQYLHVARPALRDQLQLASARLGWRTTLADRLAQLDLARLRRLAGHEDFNLQLRDSKALERLLSLVEADLGQSPLELARIATMLCREQAQA